jgi:hypothetical protein
LRRILVSLVTLLSASTAARATVVWRGDFESGDITQWNHYEGIGSRLTVVPSPVREGKYALRTELHQGDIASNGTRNELDYMLQQGEGTDLYYSWSTMFPAEYPNVTGSGMFQIFTQWHQAQNIGNAPPVVMNIVADEMRLTNYITSAVLWHAPLNRGVWHDFIVHAKWSSDPSVGFLELWYNGEKVVDHAYGPTLFPGTWVYLKQGLYRNNAIVPTAVVYHDGMTVATALEDVLQTPPAPGTTPPPSPTPPPDTTPPTDTTPPADTPPADAPPPSQTPATTAPVAQAGVGFPHGGCSSAPADFAALLGIATLALRIRRKRTGSN